MRYLLSQASQPVLTNLSRAVTLCAFDFDGTLTPISDHPGEVKLSTKTRALLKQLVDLYPCVILSGRSLKDLTQKLTGLPVDAAIGNHGAEAADAPLRQDEPAVRRWQEKLEDELPAIPGVWVENKGRSLAVHYRMSKAPDVRNQVLQATQRLKKARVYEGKKVVNIVIEGDPHKGTALTKERDRLRCDSVLYVGDDTNDEPAFDIGGNIVAVRVGKKRESRASFYLRGQSEINELLGRLIALRKLTLNG
jgi:trehalose 6-phosphate phosphatase